MNDNDFEALKQQLREIRDLPDGALANLTESQMAEIHAIVTSETGISYREESARKLYEEPPKR